MNIEFVRPLALLLLVVLPFIWWEHKRSIAPLRTGRRLISAITRGAVLTLIILAMAEPRWLGRTTVDHVILMIDRSSSLGENAVVAAREWAEQLDVGGGKIDWMPFAGRGQILAQASSLEEQAPETVLPEATDLQGAFHLASAGFDNNLVKTAVVFTDGNATEGEVDIESLVDRGIRVDVVPVDREELDEVLVKEVRAPGTIRTNEPLSLEGRIQSTVAQQVTARLFRNGIRVAEKTVDLEAGTTTIRFEDRAGEDKLLYYEIGIDAGQDTIAENNQLGVAVTSQGASKTLLITDRVESARYLEWALRQEGIDLDARPPKGLPTQMSDLQNYDAVIIDNIAASEMTMEQMELLRSYVRDFGGGFVMTGGENAYGLGGYFRTPVEDLLPVRCDFQKEEENPSLGLSLVIDRSGSMQGEKMELAKAAASAAAELLSHRDYISVIAFDHEMYPVVPIQQAGNASGVRSQIASLTASGGTNIAPGMEEALRQLGSCPAKLKHVILLTDGQSTPGPYYEIATQMAQTGITVSTVAVGSGADQDLLAQIARWGNGRYYETADPRQIPQIFTKETMTASKSAIQEFPFLAKPVRAIDFLEGVPWGRAPFLLGYVRTKPKATSETWLLTEIGDPLLSTWRYGLGTSAAFTSDARNRWAVGWLRWPGFGKFWSQLIRRITRPASLGLTEISMSSEGPRAKVEVSALSPEQGYLTDVDVSLQMIGPDGEANSQRLEKEMPGKWSADFDTSGKGVYSGQLRFERDGEVLDTSFFTHTRGFSEEFLLQPMNNEWMEEITNLTGGQLSPLSETFLADDQREAITEHELWPWLLIVAALLFVGDVASRRLPERPSTRRKPTSQ